MGALFIKPIVALFISPLDDSECKKLGTYPITNMFQEQLTNLLVLPLAEEMQELLQPDLRDQTDADLQMKCTLHPSLLSLALQRLLHGTGI
jgi:hypothetical protein